MRRKPVPRRSSCTSSASPIATADSTTVTIAVYFSVKTIESRNSWFSGIRV